MVPGSPSMCIRQQPQPREATSSAISGSPRNAVTSFTIDAPASSAASATTRLVVSTEISQPPFSAANPSTTGSTRRNSSSSATGSAPGRVDSPPTSNTAAP